MRVKKNVIKIWEIIGVDARGGKSSKRVKEATFVRMESAILFSLAMGAQSVLCVVFFLFCSKRQRTSTFMYCTGGSACQHESCFNLNYTLFEFVFLLLKQLYFLVPKKG